MSIGIAATIGMIATVAAIVLLYVKVLPKKYDGKLDNKYLQWLHNYFNFKRLYIEDILKFLFVVGTVMCVCFGFFMMFSVTETYFGDQSNFTTGLVLLIVGLQMMGVMLVRNVMDINKKMNKSLSENEDSIRKEDSINPVNSQPKIKE